MKRICCCLLVVCLLFAGCSRGNPKPTLEPDELTTPADGYVSAQTVLTGGTPMTGMNLRSVELSREGEETRVELIFVDGSDLLEIPEAATPDVPAYETDWFEGADRFVLRLSGVVYWDYLLNPPDLTSTDLQGLFVLDGEGEEASDLVMHFSQTMDLRLETRENRMTLRFSPTGEEQENVACIAVGGYEMYYSQVASDLADLGFAPALCEDGASTVLLSVPFRDEAAAQLYMEANGTRLNALMPGLSAEIQTFPSNRLPKAVENSGLDLLAETTVAEKAGVPASRVILPQGQYLCDLPDGSACLYARNLGNPAQDEDSYQMLMLHGESGDEPLLSDFEFASVSAAQFSSDGRFLALSEQTLFREELSVVTMDTREIDSPAEAGMEGAVSAFVWHDRLPILYAMVRREEDVALMAYDLSDPEHPAVSTVAGDFWKGSTLFFAQGQLWTIESDDNNLSRVCVVHPENGDRHYLEEAYALYFSPDGKTYASLRTDPDGTTVTTFSSAEQRTILSQAEGFEWIDLAWDASSACLYASAIAEDSSWEDEYPLTLYRIAPDDAAVSEWMRVKTGALYTGRQPGELWMLYIFSLQDASVPMTFTIS